MRTFGSIKLEGKTWYLDCEAHVVMRVKRMFPRCDAVARSLKVKHAADVARDLVWVMDRYPLEISPGDRMFMEAEAAAHRDRSDRFVKLLSGEEAARAFDLAIPARDYQRVAADLALQHGGLMIADDLGVGKTVSGICILTATGARPALVVTMTHLPKQWEREIKRFAPGLTTHVLKKATPYDLKQPDVIITSYSKVSGWAAALQGTVRTVIFDEGQELRRTESEKYKAAKALAESAETCRVVLTGTPIYNHGIEFFNVLDVIRPDELGTRDEFVREWCKGGPMVADPRAFGAYLREQGLMIRRTKKDVGRELPGLTVIPHTVPSEDVFEKLDGDITELARFIVSQTGLGLEQGRARGELDWRLRQATGIAKAPFVADFVRMLVDEGQKVVLFGWHHAVYDIWKERLAGIPLVMYTGEESPAAKEKARAEFIDGDARVMIISLRSGAGLDGLQHACSTVVFGELDWSPGVHEQCTGRVFRDGQKDPVTAFYLTSDEGSDPVIESTLGIKKMQLEGVRNPDDFAVAETIKSESLIDLARAVLKRKGVKAPEEAA